MRSERSSAGAEAAFTAARAADPSAMNREQLAAFMSEVKRVRAWCDAAEVAGARRAKELAEQGASGSAEAMLQNTAGRSGREARAAAERETVCDRMRGFEAALETGAVASGHVDAIAHVTRKLDAEMSAEFAEHEAALLARAEQSNVEAFERECRDLARSLVAQANAGSDADELDGQRRRATVKRWVDKITGMHHTHLELDPVRDAALWSAVNAQLASLRQRDGNRRTPWAQLQVDAFVEAAGSGSGSGDRVPEITVLIDWSTLVADAAAAGVGICETDGGVPLPVSTVRRMCCDAEIIPIVLDTTGEVMDAGRSSRTATRPQRRALRAMHRTCAHPDCTVGFDQCRIHHVRWWWEHVGPTDLDNLLPVCETHHHLVHEGGWTLTMTPDRVATWVRPDGTVHHIGTTIDRRPAGEPPAADRRSTVEPAALGVELSANLAIRSVAATM